MAEFQELQFAMLGVAVIIKGEFSFDDEHDTYALECSIRHLLDIAGTDLIVDLSEMKYAPRRLFRIIWHRAVVPLRQRGGRIIISGASDRIQKTARSLDSNLWEFAPNLKAAMAELAKTALI